MWNVTLNLCLTLRQVHQMHNAYLVAAFFLLATVIIGLIRILLMPGTIQKLLALQLLGTTSVAITILLERGLDRSSLTDLALIIALLTAIVAVAFVRYIGLTSEQSTRDNR